MMRIRDGQLKLPRHGHARGKRSPTYLSWRAMIQRTSNPAVNDYHRYGGRGIQVCERWRKFANFLADMGERPSGSTLDRIDGDGNYEPANCRWATPREQARANARMVEHDGTTMSIRDWAKSRGMPYGRLYSRLTRGWPIGQALSTPPNKGRPSCV